MEGWLHPLTSIVSYSLLLGLFGATAFRCIGLRTLCSGSYAFPAPIVAMGVAAPLVSAFLMLVAVGAMMGQPVWSLEWTALQALVATTSFGKAFLARAVLLLLALAVLLSNRRTAAAWATAATFYACALMTLAWSGHAAAGQGIPGMAHKVNDAVHLVAAGLWLGAIGWFTLLAAAAHRKSRRVSPQALLAAMHAFAPLGVALVFLVVLTGAINAHLIFGLQNSAEVFKTGYGQLLATKIGLVGVMVVCAVRHGGRGLVPRPAGPAIQFGNGAALAELRVSLTIELAVAFIVVGVVAFLTLASPITLHSVPAP